MHTVKEIEAMKLGIDGMISQLVQWRNRLDTIETKILEQSSESLNKAGVSTSALGNGQSAAANKVWERISKNIARKTNF
jgi:hypothetical protein